MYFGSTFFDGSRMLSRICSFVERLPTSLRSGPSVLPGARLGDDARLAHAFRQQRLADAVIDFVRAGVVEVLALEIDASAAGLARQPLGEVQRRRPADVMPQMTLELFLKDRVLPCLLVVLGELPESKHQRLGDVASAVGAEAALAVRGRGSWCGHDHLSL